jgi:hypothetical protein
LKETIKKCIKRIKTNPQRPARDNCSFLDKPKSAIFTFVTSSPVFFLVFNYHITIKEIKKESKKTI